MPIFRSGKGQAPAWCELESFELMELPAGEAREFVRAARKEEWVVCRGRVVGELGRVACTLPEGGKLDLGGVAPRTLRLRSEAPALVCRLAGRWRSVTSSGIFTVSPGTPPNFDTPHAYVKTTGFDNHYHDCDEYWIVWEGKATVASEGETYEVGPGDCVATGMGWHHDVLAVHGDGALRAIWFEGTLEGRKRVGHLWEPQHGPARPRRTRV